MPQGEDFAIEWFERIERLLQANLLFYTDSHVAGARQATQQVGGQIGRRGFWKRAAIERDFAGGVTGLRAEMSTMLLQQSLPGKKPQPQEERHRRILGVL